MDAVKEETVQFYVHNQQGQLLGSLKRKVLAGENYIQLKEIKGEVSISREKFIIMD